MKIEITGGTREHLVFPAADYFLHKEESSELETTGCWIELTNFYAPRKIEGTPVYIYWDRDNTTVYKDENGTGDYMFLNNEECTLYSVHTAEDVIQVKTLPKYGDSSQIYHQTSDDTYWHFELPIEKVWTSVSNNSFTFLDGVSTISGFYWYKINKWYTCKDSSHQYTDDKRAFYFDNTNAYIYNNVNKCQVNKDGFDDITYQKELHLLQMYLYNPFEETGTDANYNLFKVVYYIGKKKYFWWFTVDTSSIPNTWIQIDKSTITTPVTISSLDEILFNGESNIVYEYNGEKYLKIKNTCGYYKLTSITDVDYPRFLPGDAAKGAVYHVLNNDTYWQYGPTVNLYNESVDGGYVLYDAERTGDYTARSTVYGQAGRPAQTIVHTPDPNSDAIENKVEEVIPEIPATPTKVYWKKYPQAKFYYCGYSSYGRIINQTITTTTPDGLPPAIGSDTAIGRNTNVPNKGYVSYYKRTEPLTENPRTIELYTDAEGVVQWQVTVTSKYADPTREIMEIPLPVGYTEGNIQPGNGWEVISKDTWNASYGKHNGAYSCLRTRENVKKAYTEENIKQCLYLIKITHGPNTYYALARAFAGTNSSWNDYPVGNYVIEQGES